MKPVSSINGKIQEIFMAINATVPSPTFLNYLPVIEAFPCDVHFIIMVRGFDLGAADGTFAQTCTSAVERLLRLAGKNPDEHIYFFMPSSDRALNQFVQDPFFSFQGVPNGRRSILLKPFPVEDFTFYTDQLGSHSDSTVKPTPILFEGGNILVGSDFILAGQDIIPTNTVRRNPGLTEMEYFVNLDEELRCTFSVKEVVWVGGESTFLECTVREDGLQPLVHLDLYVTLGGKLESGEQLVYVADPKDEYVQGEPNECIKRIQIQMEDVATALAAREVYPIFKVIRMPMALRSLQEHGFSVWSYNNTQAEFFDGFKRVFLPQYHSDDFQEVLDQTNQLAREAFFEGGFDIVKTISAPILDAIHTANSSLHCITKVLRRSE